MEVIKECIRCNEKINQEVDLEKMFYYCKKCKVMCANPFYAKKLKGGEQIQMAKKERVEKTADCGSVTKLSTNDKKALAEKAVQAMTAAGITKEQQQSIKGVLYNLLK